MNYIKENNYLKNKKIILRTDFDVSFGLKLGVNKQTKNTVEHYRIERQKPMIDYLLAKESKVVMIAHISAADSFEPILDQIQKILNRRVIFIRDVKQLGELESSEQLFLLDNIRQYFGEKENNTEFAQELAGGFDLYVNNAFSVCHRKHASVSAITQFLPSYAGLLLEEELIQLQKVTDMSPRGKVIIIGGAKAESKIPVIKNFLNKAEKILVGGVIANDILKERGEYVDDSLVDENTAELLCGLNIHDPRIIMPVDYNAPDGKILDIGLKSLSNFEKIIKEAQMVVWNGPMGLFEDPNYSQGTNRLAEILANLKNYRIIGGGDTILAVNDLGLLDKFDFVSTGGGAMLSFLAGEKLPGLEALGYY